MALIEFRVRFFQPLSPLSGARNEPQKARMDGRYVTKHAKTDKGRSAYIASSSVNPGESRQRDAWRREIRPHPQGIAWRLDDAWSGRSADGGAVRVCLGNRSRPWFRGLPSS